MYKDSGLARPEKPEPAPTFDSFQLSAPLLSELERAGFTAPRPIQTKAIPVALQGRDLMARAPTGTGKTLAFALPILERLGRGSAAARHGTRVVILAPTRELAIQIRGVIDPLARVMDLTSVVLVGGIPLRTDMQHLRVKPNIVVGTPGRVTDHLRQRNLDLSRVAILVLDEADRMLDLGFLPQVRRILESMPEKRQTMLFSATIPIEIQNLATQYLRNPASLEVGAPTATAAGAKQQVIFISVEQKLPCLLALLTEEQGTCLVFTQTKAEADSLYRSVKAAGLSAAALHGDLAQNVRMRALEQFQKEHVRILIATDVAGRGLDVEGISHVVNYDVPTDPNDYIHRVGRTGRGDAVGKASTLVTYQELEALMGLERHLRKPIPRGVPPGDLLSPPWAERVPQFTEHTLSTARIFAPRGFSVRRKR
jgi:ATP-dependent RNA helicase RhlE